VVPAPRAEKRLRGEAGRVRRRGDRQRRRSRLGGRRDRGRDIWRSRADSGFRAAANVVDPRLGGVTAAGLPKRTPKANLVPGSVAAETGPASPRPPVSAEAVRSRLSSFQQGIRRGRAEVAKGSAEGSGKEEEKGS